MKIGSIGHWLMISYNNWIEFMFSLKWFNGNKEKRAIANLYYRWC